MIFKLVAILLVVLPAARVATMFYRPLRPLQTGYLGFFAPLPVAPFYNENYILLKLFKVYQ